MRENRYPVYACVVTAHQLDTCGLRSPFCNIGLKKHGFCRARSRGEMQGVQHAADAMAMDVQIMYRYRRSRVASCGRRTSSSASNGPSKRCTGVLSGIETKDPPVECAPITLMHAVVRCCPCILRVCMCRSTRARCSGRERQQLSCFSVLLCLLWAKCKMQFASLFCIDRFGW